MFSFKFFEKPLLWLLVLSLIKGIIWVSLFPAFQGPDEPSYVSYVQFLAENRKAPRSPFEEQGVGLSPQLQFIFNSLQFDALKFNPFNHQIFNKAPSSQSDVELSFFLNANDPRPKQSYPGYGYSPFYALLHLPIYFLFYGNPLLQFFSMRMISVLLHLGVVALAYFFGKFFFKSSFSSPSMPSFVLALSVAFFPMLSHISSFVHIDNLLNLGFAGFFYMCLKILTEKSCRPRDWIFLALWSIVTFMSKTHGFAVIPLLVLFFICAFGNRLFRIHGRGLFLLIMFVLTLPFIGVFLVSKTFFLRHFSLAFANVITFIHDHSFFTFVKVIIVNGFIRPIFFTFFAKFGWTDTMIEKPYYPIIGAFVLLSVLGLLVAAVKHYRFQGFKNIPIFYPFFILSFLFVVSIFLLYSLSYYNVGENLLEFSHGRYFFLFIIPLFAFLLKGFLSLFPQRSSPFVCFGVSFLILFFHFITVIQYILSRYYG